MDWLGRCRVRELPNASIMGCLRKTAAEPRWARIPAGVGTHPPQASRAAEGPRAVLPARRPSPLRGS